MIQISKELWNFNAAGDLIYDKLIRGFLPDLFLKWKSENVNHIVSVVLFGRSANFIDQSSRMPNGYQDYFQVVVDWENSDECISSLNKITRQIQIFREKIEQGPHSLLLSHNLSGSYNGNVLEAVNMALNIFDRHFIDRDLIKTGLSINIITAGAGYIETDYDLFRITKRRLIDNGVFFSLTCLGDKPLHSTPLVKIQQDKKTLNLKKVIRNRPHWILTQFYEWPVPAPLPLGVRLAHSTFGDSLSAISTVLLEISRDSCNSSLPVAPKEIALTSNPKELSEGFFHEMSPGIVSDKYHLGKSDSASGRKEPRNSCYCKSRWSYYLEVLYSYEEGTTQLNWKYLALVPCIPTESDHAIELDSEKKTFKEYSYIMTFDTVESGKIRSIDQLVEELLLLRFSQGYQLIRSELNKAKLLQPLEKKEFLLSLGHDYQIISALDAFNVLIKVYLSSKRNGGTAIEYKCQIQPIYYPEFFKGIFQFNYPDLNTFNWNLADQVISGFLDDFTEDIKYWRTRFILIPAKLPEKTVLFVKNEIQELDDEELKVEGFFKFIEAFELAILENKSSRAKIYHPNYRLQIQMTTLTPLGFINNETCIAEPEDFRKRSNSAPKQDFTIYSDLKDVVSRMEDELLGVNIKDRRWHWKIYKRVFVGSELVDWLLKFFSDLETREEAIGYGSKLLSQGYIEHATKVHGFLDGYYYYRISQKYSKKSSKGIPWFRRSSQKKEVDERAGQVTIPMSRKLTLNVDPMKKSDRTEWAVLHYDAVHNPRLCYHFQIHWLSCAAKLLEDLIQSWTRRARQCGFLLVEAPVDQVTGLSNQNPFLAPIQIKPILAPPDVAEINRRLKGIFEVPRTYFEEEFLKFNGFCLDMEKGTPMFSNPLLDYSYQGAIYKKTQYIHRSGSAFVQICEDSSVFYWVGNRIFNARTKCNTHEKILMDFLRLCSDETKLKDCWIKILHSLSSKSGIGRLLDSVSICGSIDERELGNEEKDLGISAESCKKDMQMHSAVEDKEFAVSLKKAINEAYHDFSKNGGNKGASL